MIFKFRMLTINLASRQDKFNNIMTLKCWMNILWLRKSIRLIYWSVLEFLHIYETRYPKNFINKRDFVLKTKKSSKVWRILEPQCPTATKTSLLYHCLQQSFEHNHGPSSPNCHIRSSFNGHHWITFRQLLLNYLSMITKALVIELSSELCY